MTTKIQVAKLQRKIAELEDKVKRYQDSVLELFCDDIYEYILIARSEALTEKLKDVVNCKVDFYRQLSDKDPTMNQILMFFEGKTIRAKKDALREYLRENPIFRTQKPELLLQRLRLTRKYSEEFSHREIPEHPIQDAIDELNPQEAPKAPKDEDFLE